MLPRITFSLHCFGVAASSVLGFHGPITAILMQVNLRQGELLKRNPLDSLWQDGDLVWDSGDVKGDGRARTPIDTLTMAARILKAPAPAALSARCGRPRLGRARVAPRAEAAVAASAVGVKQAGRASLQVNARCRGMCAPLLRPSLPLPYLTLAQATAIASAGHQQEAERGPGLPGGGAEPPCHLCPVRALQACKLHSRMCGVPCKRWADR